ncbi:MAG: FHA domain-containing protein [Gemmataceae bacterium]
MRLFLEHLKDGKPGQRIVVKDGDSLVGRSEECKIRIPASNVSRRHCKLTLKDDLAFVVDLQSVNGTFVNGVKITKSTILREGDLLLIGSSSFKVVIPTVVSDSIDPIKPDKNKPNPVGRHGKSGSIPSAHVKTENEEFHLELDMGESIIPILDESSSKKSSPASNKKKKTEVGSDEFIELEDHGLPSLMEENNVSIRISDGANLRDILSQLDGLDDEKH